MRLRGSRERVASAVAACEWMESLCAESGLHLCAQGWAGQSLSLRRRLLELEAAGPLRRLALGLSGHAGRVLRAAERAARRSGWAFPEGWR